MSVCCVGEPMIELSFATTWQLHYGGDTLNTAVHLARLNVLTSYFSAIGPDAFSQSLRQQLEQERLQCSTLQTHPKKNIGLYAINNDRSGERTFSYWRSDSAAKEMFTLESTPASIEKALEHDVLYFSLVSLAILNPNSRIELIRLAADFKKRGKKVIFDTNYRPSLWASPAEALHWHDQAVSQSHLVFPTEEDERALNIGHSMSEIIARLKQLGAERVILKIGSKGCMLDDGTIIPTVAIKPLDTSGAGDAFNAGYIAAWLGGKPPPECALSGHAVAAWVISRIGAIPQIDSAYPVGLP